MEIDARQAHLEAGFREEELVAESEGQQVAVRHQRVQSRRTSGPVTGGKSFNMETSENVENQPVVNMVNKNKSEKDNQLDSTLQNFLNSQEK